MPHKYAGCVICHGSTSISIYFSSYGIYIAPLQDNYSEALQAQAWAKTKLFRRLINELKKSRGRERNSRGRPFQIEGPAAGKCTSFVMIGGCEKLHKVV